MPFSIAGHFELMSIDNYSNQRPTCRRLVWITFARFLTFFIPDFILSFTFGLKTPSSRIAWREKVTLLALYVFSAAFFCIWLEFISSYFCEPEKTYEYMQVFSNSSKMTAINGKAVNWRHIGQNSTMINFSNAHPHHDISPNFPKFMSLSRKSSDQLYSNNILNECIYNQNKSTEADAWLNYFIQSDTGYAVDDTNTLISCPLPNQRNTTGAPCFYGSQANAQLNSLPMKGNIEYNPTYIAQYHSALPTPQNASKTAFVILDGYVLDVTSYFQGATTIIPVYSTASSRSFAQDRLFLPLDLTLFLYVNLGQDITDYFTGNITENPALYRSCLVQLFERGVVPSHIASGCRRINPALWATMGVGLLYFLIKMNLVYLSRVSFIKKRLFRQSPETLKRWPYAMLVIPCFAESSGMLKQTVESLSRTTYDDDKKVLLFVCDGVVTNAKEQQPTHVLLLECLGYSGTEEPIAHAYQSLGQDIRKVNSARVYSGYYESGGRVPYLVVVKESNRGKRDSLSLVFGFLERCRDLSRHLITPLEYELFNTCFNVLGVDPRQIKYLMVTDADIQVQNDIVQKLVVRLEGDSFMLAVSGHVRPANPEENLTTMLQIFPAYMAYFSSLAYEACLKSVMSVNGGLTMYRVWKEQPLSKISDENPFRDSIESTRVESERTACCVHPTVLRGIAMSTGNTMHMQNVLLLGEEKIIPIILLKSHPGHRLGFEPDAVGYTMLPTSFRVLQGMQSRSIRAAFHAQFEFQRVSWQLGFGYWIISTTQLLDMIFSMPIFVYLYGVFGRALCSYGMAYTIIAISFGGLAALNVLLFVLRHQFRYIAWFVLYCLLAIPLFAIWFPLLSIWQSNQAEYWYDTWPTTAGTKRLHGTIAKASSVCQKDTPRMTLADHERMEIKRLHQALDSKFVGFANEAVTVTADSEIATPPVRKGVHSTRITTPDLHTWNSSNPFVDDEHQIDESLMDSFGSSGFDHVRESLDDEERASVLSITSNTFSVYTPEDPFEEPTMPRHRIVGGSLETSVKNNESGRNKAVHNLNTFRP